MKKLIKTILLLCICGSLASCYDDYVHDYDYSSVGFAIQNPVRTVVADREMKLYLGVYIGGKREINMSDWVKFEIVPELLDNTRFTLLPENYYRLDDTDTFRIRKPNLPVADVGITFTEDFYADPNSVNASYALPMRITEHSLDSIPEGKSHSIIAIKYISTFSGIYYVRGEMDELDATGESVENTRYYHTDISQNLTRPLVTLNANTLIKHGVANRSDVWDSSKTQVQREAAAERLMLTIQVTEDTNKEYDITVEKAYLTMQMDIKDATGKYFGNPAQGERRRIELKYTYTLGGIDYRVEETLYLQRDPEDALRVETW